ncbi:hypothetical protein EDB86DRAFT_603452 [Lactarius hatsudake]|nr:hypothetical protein EDB86DRAFT_603452 [Lactarius hatsudake]
MSPSPHPRHRHITGSTSASHAASRASHLTPLRLRGTITFKEQPWSLRVATSIPFPHLSISLPVSPPRHFFAISPQVSPRSSPSVATISHIGRRRPLQPAFTNHQGSARERLVEPHRHRIGSLYELPPYQDYVRLPRMWRRRKDDHGDDDDDDMKTITAAATTAKTIKTAAATRKRLQRRQRRHEDDQDGSGDGAKTIKTTTATTTTRR